MEKKNVKQLPLSVFEIVSYAVCFLVALWGISYIIVGLVARFTAFESACSAANREFSSVFGLGFLGWGLIILTIAAIVAVVILCVNASTTDREFEKNQRRAARLAQMKEARKNPEAVVDAEIETK